MKPVIQEEVTGCAIASAAAIAGLSYEAAKELANSMGIFAEDSTLWSATDCIRKLLSNLGIETSTEETPFTDWDAVPDLALLATKWHMEDDTPYWHWAVFVRNASESFILDSNKSLKKNKRTDFGRIKPKWFITVQI